MEYKESKHLHFLKRKIYTRYAGWQGCINILPETEMNKFKIGDIVSYRNTRGNIKKAEITSFETVDNGKVWFHGIDTETKAKVWYPVHISEKLIR